MADYETDEDLELERLEDEFEAMCDDYDAIRRGGNYNEARRLGREIRAFARRHQQIIEITDEQIDKLTAICRAHEIHWFLQELSDCYLKEAKRSAKEATEKYHQLLLELPPHGRNRTNH